MTQQLQYKGYIGSISFDSENEIFYGKVEFIRDLIAYETEDAKGLKKVFADSVEDYLELCAEQEKEPDQPFKGSLNVRIGPSLHKAVAHYACAKGKKTNQIIKDALQAYLKLHKV